MKAKLFQALLIVVLILGFAPIPVTAAASPKELFVPIKTPRGLPSGTYVDVRDKVLVNRNGDPTKARQFQFNLEEGVSYVGVVDNVTDDSNGIFWEGHVQDFEGGYFSISYYDEEFRFFISTPQGWYTVTPLPSRPERVYFDVYVVDVVGPF